MDRTDAMILQNVCWIIIRDSIGKDVINCDTFQNKKRSNIKYGKFPSKETEEMSWNKLCVDIIGLYSIIIKGQRENLNLKYFTMIYHVTGWF